MGGGECRFRVRKHSIYTCFFLKWWPNWTGSVQSVSDFENRTEPKLFCDFLIGLFSFFQFGFFSFFSGFFGLISLLVFLLTSSLAGQKRPRHRGLQTTGSRVCRTQTRGAG
jgi:hypothetical protein